MKLETIAELRRLRQKAAESVERANHDSYALSLARAGAGKLYELALVAHADELLAAAEERAVMEKTIREIHALVARGDHGWKMNAQCAIDSICDLKLQVSKAADE